MCWAIGLMSFVLGGLVVSAHDKSPTTEDDRQELLGKAERTVWRIDLSDELKKQGVESVELVFFGDSSKNKEGHLANLNIKMGNSRVFSAARYELKTSGKDRIMLYTGSLLGKEQVTIPYRFEDGKLTLGGGLAVVEGAGKISLKGNWKRDERK